MAGNMATKEQTEIHRREQLERDRENLRDALLIEMAKALSIIGQCTAAIQPTHGDLRVSLDTNRTRLAQLSTALHAARHINPQPV
jgi:C4-dicarboxylate-specific signal transduction histidine kinase